MCPRREWFENFSEFVEPVKIWVGDDSELVATGSGDIETNVGRLTKVYFVPNLCANLFSVSAACDQGIDFKFDNNGLKRFLRGEKLLSRWQDLCARFKGCAASSGGDERRNTR